MRIGKQRIPLDQAKTTIRLSAEWFYWIAGLSLVDYCATEFADWSTGMGLGVTLLVHGHGRPVSLGVALLAAVCLAALGYFARRLAVWAFAVGYLAYLADAILLARGQAWFAVAFHVFALLVVVGGFWHAIAVKTGRSNPVLWGGRTSRKRRRRRG